MQGGTTAQTTLPLGQRCEFIAMSAARPSSVIAAGTGAAETVSEVLLGDIEVILAPGTRLESTCFLVYSIHGDPAGWTRFFNGLPRG